jgi:hypothetical protein
MMMAAAPCIAPGLLLAPRHREPIGEQRFNDLIRSLEQTPSHEWNKVPMVYPEPQGCPIIVILDTEGNPFAP